MRIFIKCVSYITHIYEKTIYLIRKLLFVTYDLYTIRMDIPLV